ncbi:MAG TPA: CoA pyrophosphatase [Pseudomonadales bacterium]|nr:CoA pyrophosphatase [Pseudomonadales bacterium]
MLTLLRQGLKKLQPVDHWRESSFRSEAAVLLAFTDEPDTQLVLTRRADHLKSHRGEVALPGGKIDPTDESIIAAALRESHEEIDLLPSAVEVLGQLDPMVTRFGVKVTPVVGIIAPDTALTPNPDELDSIFRVPLAFFLRDERLRTDRGTVNGHAVAVPCWNWQGYEIWGVTAIIIVNLMNRVLGQHISTGVESLAQKTNGRIMPEDWLTADD